MYLTQTIINAVNDTLWYLEEHKNKITEQFKVMPPNVFIEHFLSLKLRFPRGSGHSSAAKQLMLQHDNSILITPDSRWGYQDYLMNHIGIPKEKTFSFWDLSRNIRVYSSLSLVIFDWLDGDQRKKLSELKQKLLYTNDVKLFVELG